MELSYSTLRLFKTGSVLVLLCLTLLAGCGRPTEGRDSAAPGKALLQGRPDVVMIMVDTLRADRLPFHGYQRPTAPFASELAARGVVFEQADSHSSWTAPSLANLFTSLFPEQHTVRQGVVVSEGLDLEMTSLPEAIPTLAEAFRDAGYETFGVGDNPNLRYEMGLQRGFDLFADLGRVRPAPGYNPAGIVAEAVIEWRRHRRNDRPAFLYIHFMDPHAPYHDRQTLDPPHPSDPQAANYDSEIRYFDDVFKQLYAACNWDENTLLVFLSDHGEELGERGHYGHGRTLYQESVHVPLFFHAPGLGIPARRISEPVGLVDVFPTLAELLGLGLPDHAEGHSLARVITGLAPGPDPRPLYGSLFSPWNADDPITRGEQQALRDGPWRLLVAGTRIELYNLQHDPAQTNNLVVTRSGMTERLNTTLTEIKAELGRTRFDAEKILAPVDEADRRRLQSLGYTR